MTLDPGKGYRFGKGSDNPKWIGDNAGKREWRRRTRRTFQLTGICEMEGCKEIATNRHHLDEDTSNLDKNNIMFLCSRCHALLHANRIGSVRQRGSRWQGRIRIYGKRFERNFSSKREAEDWIVEMTKDI
jgi:hypothetical protein